MRGLSLCNSVSLHSCFSHLCSSQKSRFFTSLCSGTSTYISFVPRSRVALLKAQTFLEKRNDGFRSFAAKKRRNDRGGVVESDEDWDSYGVVAGDEDDDDDEGVFLPLERMNKWLENKPRGFGEGKVYDTSVEDKLLDEIVQSRNAQAANLNKLKNKPVKAEPKSGDKNAKEAEDAQIGTRVRVSNLPKKKNIHKDLKSAFKGVSGILDIIPSVSGNKKTRDPVCKGFAFVDFRTDTDATRFVDIFSGQRISFGKVQKQIKCQVLDSSSSTSSSEQEYSDEGSEEEWELLDTDLKAVSNADFVVEDAFLDTQADSDESVYSNRELHETKMEDGLQILVSSSSGTPKGLRDNHQGDKIDSSIVSFRESEFEETVAEAELNDQLDMVDMGDVEENIESAGVEKLKDAINEAIRQPKSIPTSSEEERLTRIRQLERKLLSRGKLWSGADSNEPQQKQDKVRKKNGKKKILAKGQAKKGKKLEIPGSSKRLKVKEKVALTGVLSKYASKAASSSNDELSHMKTES